MARVFKRVWTQALSKLPPDYQLDGRRIRFRDPKTRQRREAELSRDELRAVFESEHWSVEYLDTRGKPHAIVAFADKAVSEQLARLVDSLAGLKVSRSSPDADTARAIAALPDRIQKRLRDLELISTTTREAARPLIDHLEPYLQALRDGVATTKQNRTGPATAGYVQNTAHRVRTLLAGIGANHAADVTPERVGRYLAQRRGRPRAKDGLSAKSSNHYIGAIVGFLNWCDRTKRIVGNPLSGMPTIPITPRLRQHVRRCFEIPELVLLLDKTRSGPAELGMSGEARYWLYRLAAETGLRSNELRALTRASFQLDGGGPSVWLPGDDTKNRENAELPLRLATAAELKEFLALKTPTAPVFNMPRKEDVVVMLRRDLARAEIPYEDGAGRRRDFHALRVSFITYLAAAGVPPKVAQRLARHHSVELTMTVYAQTLIGTDVDAIAQLPDLSTFAAEAQAATGTLDPSPTPPPLPPGAQPVRNPTDCPTDWDSVRQDAQTCANTHDYRTGTIGPDRDAAASRPQSLGMTPRPSPTARPVTNRAGTPAALPDTGSTPVGGIPFSREKAVGRSQLTAPLTGDPRLNALIDAWPSLPEAARVAVQSIVELAGAKDGADEQLQAEHVEVRKFRPEGKTTPR